MIADPRRGINPQATPIYVGGRVIGRVEHGIFHKTIKTSHMLRTPPAHCFDRSVLNDIEAAGAKTVRIYNRETGVVYTATVERIREKGFAPNRMGFANQWGLKLEEWSIDGQRPKADVQAAQTNAEIKELQLGLFGEVA